MLTRCSRDDYISLSLEKRRQLTKDFLKYLEEKHPDSEFGYNSFLDLEYDQMVLSTIFSELKEGGFIRSTGYMVFRLIK